MLRAAHYFSQIPTSSAATEKSGSALDPIALFCGIGLAAFVVAIVTGVQGVWY
jgi:hypothetical protein